LYVKEILATKCGVRIVFIADWKSSIFAEIDDLWITGGKAASLSDEGQENFVPGVFPFHTGRAVVQIAAILDSDKLRTQYFANIMRYRSNFKNFLNDKAPAGTWVAIMYFFSQGKPEISPYF
jgi:hypothetical protein